MSAVVKALWHALLVQILAFGMVVSITLITQRYNQVIQTVDESYKMIGHDLHWISVGVGISSYIMSRLQEIKEDEHDKDERDGY